MDGIEVLSQMTLNMRWGTNPDRQALKKAEFLPVIGRSGSQTDSKHKKDADP